MNDKKVIAFMKSTECDKPNINGITYSGEEFNNALKEWRESGRTLYLTIADQKYLSYDNIKEINIEDVIGEVIEITNDIVFIKPTRTDIQYDVLSEKYAAGMRYTGNVEIIDGNKVVKNIKIISYDLVYKDLRSFKLGIDKMPVWFNDLVKSAELTLHGETNTYATTKNDNIIEYGTKISLSPHKDRKYDTGEVYSLSEEAE